MSSNLPFSAEGQGGEGQKPAPQGLNHHLTLKARAVQVLRAYIESSPGQAVEAVSRALAGLEPVPSLEEAESLTQKIAAPTRSRALIRHAHFLASRDPLTGCADGGRGHFDPCECGRKRNGGQGGAAAVEEGQGSHKSTEALVTPDRPRSFQKAKATRRDVFGKHLRGTQGNAQEHAQEKAIGWESSEPQPFDLDRFLADEGKGE